MAWARLVTYPGGTEAQFRAVIEELGAAYVEAPGRTFLAAGPSELGWQMFTVWDSKESFQRWAAEHVGPAHERVGDRGWKSQPEVLDFETYDLLP